METGNKTVITVETEVNIPVEKAWDIWTNPDHIIHWNFASDDWCAPHAKNDLRLDGKFSYRMEAKDGSMAFDFSGKYVEVNNLKSIVCNLDDGRQMHVSFNTAGNSTKIIEQFEAESENSIELQKAGWQAILNNYKKYAESI